ncbi:hypothetical protein [Sphingomonas koreensis]
MTASRWWETRWFVLAAMLLAAVPLLWPTVPPLTDLPGHIGRYRVMLGDAPELGPYYSFQWRVVGNLGVDLLVAALGPWIGLEPAVKAVVIAIPVLTTGALLWLSRELTGRISPWALFALPLAYSYFFQFGFVNFTLAMALALAGWALWLRMARLGQMRARAVLFVAIGLIVWITHVMGWAMLCLFVFGGECARLRSAGAKFPAMLVRAGLACLPLAPPLLALLLWRSGGAGDTERFFDLMVKLKGLGSVLRDRWLVFDTASAALLLILIYAGVRGRIGRIVPQAAFVAGLAALAFLLLPFLLMGSAYADLRLLPYAMMVALAGLAPGAGTAPHTLRRIALTALVFLVLRTIATTASFVLYDRDWTRELAALDHLPRGARVLVLAGDTCEQPWAHSRRVHLGGLAIARRGAFTNGQWRMAGAPLLSVKVQGAGYFGHDPSQISVPAPCAIDPNLMPQARALAEFPRNLFTHVWMIRPHPAAPGEREGLIPLWQHGDSVLYAVDRPSSRLPLGPAPK